MTDKNHLPTSATAGRQAARDIRRTVQTLYIGNPETLTRNLTEAGSTQRTESETGNTEFPILKEINDLSDNVQTMISDGVATIQVNLDNAAAHFSSLELDDNSGEVTEFVIDYVGLAKNKVLEFITHIHTIFTADRPIDFRKDGTPIIIGGLPDAFGDSGNQTFQMGITAMETPTATSFQVMTGGGGGGGGGGEFVGPWTAAHNAGMFQLHDLSAVFFSLGTDLYAGAIATDPNVGIYATVPDVKSFSIRTGSFPSTDYIASFSNSLGLNMHGNSIINPNILWFGGASGQIFNLHTISFTNSGYIQSNAASFQLHVSQSSHEFEFIYGTDNTVITSIDSVDGLDIKNIGIRGAAVIRDITALNFGSQKTITSLNDDLNIVIPSSGKLNIKESSTNFMELDGVANVVRCYRDITLTSGEAIRADGATEIGIYVTNTSANPGTAGSMQMPTTPTINNPVTNAKLNAAFGSAVGCFGVFNTSTSNPVFCMKNLTNQWVLMSMHASGAPTMGRAN